MFLVCTVSVEHSLLCSSCCLKMDVCCIKIGNDTVILLLVEAKGCTFTNVYMRLQVAVHSQVCACIYKKVGVSGIILAIVYHLICNFV